MITSFIILYCCSLLTVKKHNVAYYQAWIFAHYLAYSSSMDHLAGLPEETRTLALCHKPPREP